MTGPPSGAVPLSFSRDKIEKNMRRYAVACCLFAVCSLAQSPTDVFDKAPPEVEKALRERAAIFFQAHVDGKFRQAEKVIHADSQDDYYNSEKQRLINFEISKITYSDKFTKAVVIADVELDWVTARTGKIRVKPPMKTVWKLDEGQWWWYAPTRTKWETPFGEMKPGADFQRWGAGRSADKDGRSQRGSEQNPGQ